jgi:hypothetical protein
MKTSQERLREYYSDSENKSIKSNTSNDNSDNSDNSSQKSKINSLFSYPSLDDENIMIKISEKHEFNDSKAYEQNIDKLNEIASKICNQDFQLAPHQIFIRNFLSKMTPYNSLLLYHGLGTGKTCSAIGVAEEMRQYMQQMNIRKKILIIASPNVQDNFKLQLFNESKLKKLDNGSWNVSSCVGQSLYKEVNILNDDSIEKEEILEKVNTLINKYYEFMGYTKLASLINSKKKKGSLKETFEGRLLIIDEAHNIRPSDLKQKKVSSSLNMLVEEVNNMRILLLSATPMFDNYREIIHVINILLKNEKKPILIENEIFDKNGNFKLDENGEQIGKIKFMRKINGLISFVQGENPFSFPFRIFPKLFANEISFKNNSVVYPKYQLNNSVILTPLEHVDVYPVSLQGFQKEIYERIIQTTILSKEETRNVEINDDNELRLEEPQVENELKKEKRFGYNSLQEPLEALNIIFPNENKEDELNEYTGKKGLQRIVNNVDSLPYEFINKYLENARSIFSEQNIENYSSKIKQINKSIQQNKGISLIFSQYIYGGIVPIAIMLEELGFVRYGEHKSFLSDSYKRTNSIKPFLINGKQATYSMITSNAIFSNNNNIEINAATSDDNKDGSIINVILITKAGSEGIDLKNIRSIHVLEPWYNMNRIEQIIGRGVRNCSHKQLELKERNVLIYLYGTHYDNKEGADIYVYRLAEKKAMQIGKVSRVMKNNAIDCILQSPNRNHMDDPKVFPLTLANTLTIDYNLENQSYSSNCDYMKTCAYKCSAVKNNKVHDNDSVEQLQIKNDTYDEKFLQTNLDSLKETIKLLFQNKYLYTKEELFQLLQLKKHYPKIQILKAIEDMKNANTIDFLYDEYGSKGRLIETNNIFLFQPFEINSNHIMMEERMRPIDVKINSLNLEVSNNKSKTNEQILENDGNNEILYGTMFDEMKNNISNEIDNVSIVLTSKFNISQTIMDEILLEYFYDNLPYETKYKLFLQIMNEDITNTKSLDHTMKKVIEKNIFTKNDLKYYVIVNGDNLEGFIHQNNKWDNANKIHFKEFEKIIDDKYYYDEKNMPKYSGLLFSKTEKSTKKKTFVFKIKETNKSRNASAVCKTYKEHLRLDIIQNITDQKYENKFYKSFNSERMCLFIQFYFRYRQYQNDNSYTWFMNPEQSLYNKLHHKVLKF